nr:MAG TPA: hypothetical protein [Caudoviricetes sp.]
MSFLVFSYDCSVRGLFSPYIYRFYCMVLVD